MNAPKTIASACVGLCLLVLMALRAGAQSSPKELSWYLAHAPFAMPPVATPQIPQRDFRLTDYGANGNGEALNTDAFAKAIKACADAGGGRVIVPAGQWLTGPIGLLSHVELHLEANALIQFTRDHAAYA